MLLGIALVEDETSLSCDQHVYLIKFVLFVFEKSFRNVISLIGDTFSVNTSIVTKLGLGFVGCAMNLFILEVKNILSEHDGIVTSFQAVIVKVRGLISAAKNREFTSLKNVLNNVTRWSIPHSIL